MGHALGRSGSRWRGAAGGCARAATVGVLATLVASAPVGGAAGASGTSSLARAEHALLSEADVPSGWSAQGTITTSDGGATGGGAFPGDNLLPACLGVSKALINLDPPSVISPTFQSATRTLYVQDNVGVFASARQAAAEGATYENPKVAACMTRVLRGPAHQQLETSLGQGQTMGSISVAPVGRAALVPHTSGFTISFPVTTHGVTIHAAISIITMVRGKLGNQLTLTSIGAPFPTSLERRLESAAYRRT